MNYTKGEWTVQDGDFGPQIVCDDQDDNTVLIAEVNPYHEDDKTIQANARLIVAAPDMYEALKDIIAEAEKSHLTIGADLDDSIRVFGKQALAKAEGKVND